MNPNLAGIIALCMFGTSSVMVVSMLEIPPFQLNFMTMLMGGFLLTSLQLYQRKNIWQSWKQGPGTYAGVVGGVGLYFVLLYTSFQHGPAFEVNALNYLWPIMIVLLSAAVHRDQIGVFRITGSLLGFMGMGLLLIPAHGGQMFGNVMPGHLLAVIAAFVWGYYTVWARGKNYPVEFMAPVVLIISLLSLALHLAFETTVIPKGVEWLLIGIIGCNRTSLALWDYGVRRGDALLLASLSYFVPLASTLLFILFGFKPANGWVAIGGFLIVAGCLVVNARQLITVFKKKAAE